MSNSCRCKSVLYKALVAFESINTSIANSSIMENIKHSTVYGIYIKEILTSNIMREVPILTTRGGGKLTIEFKSSCLEKNRA